MLDGFGQARGSDSTFLEEEIGLERDVEAFNFEEEIRVVGGGGLTSLGGVAET